MVAIDEHRPGALEHGVEDIVIDSVVVGKRVTE
jgi:hypothetical protein